MTGASPNLVPALVVAHASRAPHRPAVTDGRRTLSYGELEAQAGRLAQALRGLGCGPDVPVALAVDHSIEMVVGALGIMRAGGAYFPLDPAYPASRLAFMIADARPAAIVTVADVAPSLPGGDCPLVLLDERDTAGSSLAGPMPPLSATARDLAYVIYTSGSTGRPKGVEVTHGNLLNLVRWHTRAFAVAQDDRATLLSSASFDAAVWETWPYLASGAGLVVVPADVRLDPARLRDWLVEQRISVAFAPTALAERLIRLAWPSHTTLRALLTGADTLHGHPPERLPFALVNNYGPTEATVVATSGTIAPTSKPERRPSIGRPIDNVQVWILDEHQEPVRVGVAGELHIGGAGVARGYRGRPELTAERFVPDPFSTAAGARLYRTGDRARWLPDGAIEFLGRMDGQLKIRGFRVEPDEIIGVLNAHPHVVASAVAVREDRLVAYVVAAGAPALSASDLQATLRRSVPEYMVPSVFVRLDALPLTSNGKLDRDALPAPDDANTLRDHGLVAPRTVVEARLAALLATLLEVEQVGVEDNFFLLGGHSLLGAQLLTRIRDTFGVELPLRTVFDVPTVAGLATAIENAIVQRLAHATGDGPATLAA